MDSATVKSSIYFKLSSFSVFRLLFAESKPKSFKKTMKKIERSKSVPGGQPPGKDFIIIIDLFQTQKGLIFIYKDRFR